MSATLFSRSTRAQIHARLDHLSVRSRGKSGDLLVTRVVEGFGFATLTVAEPKMIVAATEPGVRRFALGAWGTYMPVGFALSLVTATVLLGSIGWRGFWFLNAGLLMLFVLVFAHATAPHRWQVPACGGRMRASRGRWLRRKLFPKIPPSYSETAICQERYPLRCQLSSPRF